jgi:methionyl-tRNA formyltransferase
MLFDTLPDILSGSIQPKPQKSNGVSITSLISKKEGQLHPETDDATILERKIRAHQGFPKSHLTLFDNDVIITSAQVVENPSTSQLVIPCANETWLKVDTLVAPSGRTMSGDAVLHGYSRGKTKSS